MLYLITEALLSGVIIMAASEAAKRSPAYGALIVSLPLISILAMIWLWRDTRQWADSGSFGRNVLACVADPTDVSRATRDAEKWLCVLDRTCDLMRSDRGSLLGSFLALGLGSRERRAFCR
jgi:hypothetical protein